MKKVVMIIIVACLLFASCESDIKGDSLNTAYIGGNHAKG